MVGFALILLYLNANSAAANNVLEARFVIGCGQSIMFGKDFGLVMWYISSPKFQASPQKYNIPLTCSLIMTSLSECN